MVISIFFIHVFYHFRYRKNNFYVVRDEVVGAEKLTRTVLAKT